ncbi:MAG: AbrB/MazE/SpoVT family DNA-binding domain-containing protein [Candidatus Baldrarchaeia archaeon]
MTLRLKVGAKGYIVIPKSVREAYGISEGDYVAVELRSDGILLKPIRRVDRAQVLRKLEEHRKRLEKLGIVGPRPEELAGVYLEEEFEDEGVSRR